MPLVSALYAALVAILAVLLGLRVVALRQRHRVGIGDGGQPPLARAIRVHGNLVETAPLALLLLQLSASCRANSNNDDENTGRSQHTAGCTGWSPGCPAVACGQSMALIQSRICTNDDDTGDDFFGSATHHHHHISSSQTITCIGRLCSWGCCPALMVCSDGEHVVGLGCVGQLLHELRMGLPDTRPHLRRRHMRHVCGISIADPSLSHWCDVWMDEWS